MAKIKLYKLLNGYDSSPDGTKSFLDASISGSPKKGEGGRLSRMLATLQQNASTLVSYTSTRTYGLFLWGLGLSAMLLHFAFEYFSGAPIDPQVLILGVVITIIGVPFLLADKPLFIAFQEFPPTNYVFFEFFCLKRLQKKEGVRGLHPVVGLLIGISLAVLSVFVPLWAVVLAVGTLVFVFLAFMSPEFSLFVSCLAFPYLPFFEYRELILGIMVAVSVASFIRKVALGKRVYHFEQYDALLFLFLLFVLVSGIFVKGVESFGSSLVIVLFAMGYVLSSSLLANRRLADCMINSIVISALPMSIYSICQAVQIFLQSGFAGYEGVSGSFDTPSELALFLLIAAIFALCFVKQRKLLRAKAVYLVFFILIFAALLCTASTWVFVTGLFGVLAYGVTRLRRFSRISLIVICLCPYALIFLPYDMLASLADVPVISSLNLAEYALRWQSCVEMFLNNIFFGIGIGEACFAEEIVNVAGEVTYTDSGSFLLEIGLEAGVFALAIFVLIFAVALRHRAYYRSYVRHSSVNTLSRFAIVALACIFVFGAFNYVWSDMIFTYLFWCVFGTASAALRISKREHDDRVGYFSDGRSLDSSSVDIEIL